MHALLFVATILCTIALALSSPEYDAEAERGVQARILFKRDYITDYLHRCIQNPNQLSNVNNNDCPTNSAWKDIHCVNNEFGTYTSDQNFLPLGAGPFGVRLAPHRCAIQNQCGSQESNSQEKIKLLESENDMLSNNITSLKEYVKKIKEENQELRHKLIHKENTMTWQSNAIETLEFKLTRCKQGKIECHRENEQTSDKSAMALHAANSQIKNLVNENEKLIQINTDLSETVSQQQLQLKKMEDVSTSCSSDLAACKTEFVACHESSEELQELLSQANKEHIIYAGKCQSDYERLQERLVQEQTSLKQLDMRLKQEKIHNKGLQREYHDCLNDSSVTKEMLTDVQKDLRRCKIKHNITVEHKEQCSEDMAECKKKATELYTYLVKCTSEDRLAKMKLESLHKSVNELEKTNARCASNVQKKIRTIERLQTSSYELRKILKREEERHRITTAKLTKVTVEATTMERKLVVMEDKYVSVQKRLTYLTHLEKNQSKEMSHLEHKLKVAQSRNKQLMFWVTRCRDGYNEMKTECLKISQSETACRSELKRALVMREAILKQLEASRAGHNDTKELVAAHEKELDALGEENDLLEDKLAKVNADLKALNSMYSETKELSEKLSDINQNINDRLKQQLAALGTLTQVHKNCARMNRDLKDRIDDLNHQLHDSEHSATKAQKELDHCENALNQSISDIDELKANMTLAHTHIRTLHRQLDAAVTSLEGTRNEFSRCKGEGEKLEHTILDLKSQLSEAQTLLGLERENKLRLDKLYNACKSNHSDILENAEHWEEMHIRCQSNITSIIVAHQQEARELRERIKKISAELSELQELKRRLELDNDKCTTQNTDYEARISSLTQQVQALKETRRILSSNIRALKMKASHLGIDIIKQEFKINNLIRKKSFLQDDIENLQEQTVKCASHAAYLGEELRECYQQQSENRTCPQATGGENFYATDSGCMLQTHKTLNYKDLHAFCASNNATVASLDNNDNGQMLAAIDMLKEVGQNAEKVWIRSPNDTLSEPNTCFSLDLPVALRNETLDIKPEREDSCEAEHHGLCVIE